MHIGMIAMAHRQDILHGTLLYSLGRQGTRNESWTLN